MVPKQYSSPPPMTMDPKKSHTAPGEPFHESSTPT